MITIQKELHDIRNKKTLADYNALFTKLNNLVKEESDMDIFEFLKERNILADTVNHNTISKYSYKNNI